jgi:allantoate deiminase
VARCDALGVAPYSDTPGGLFRGYLSPAYAAAQEAIAGWMIEAGMTVRIDAAANLIGRYKGGIGFGVPPLLIASHIDSVRDAGRYDGPLGVMLGIEAVAALEAAGRRPDFPIEVIAFGDEEGSRFPASMLTSRAVAGTLGPAALAVADRDGVTLDEALGAYRRLVATWQSKREDEPAFSGIADFSLAGRISALAYLEAHIEQGPVLEAEGLALGIVTGIAAQLRYQVEVKGMAGHAGTTTMTLRRDALAAAAEAVLAVERAAQDDASDLVATVGRLSVAPGAPNVIPGRVDFTIDIRSGDQRVRDGAAKAILAELDAIAARRGVSISAEQVQDLAASPCDPGLTGWLADAVAAEGLPPRRLVSGAGHDAMVMAALCPTAMLFIRCAGGISHNPAEHVDPADADAALKAMLGFIDRLGDNV